MNTHIPPDSGGGPGLLTGGGAGFAIGEDPLGPAFDATFIEVVVKLVGVAVGAMRRERKSIRCTCTCD